MTIELFALLASVLLCLVLPLVYSACYARQVGIARLAGNREDLPKARGAAGRGIRAHRNLLENLLPFAAVVLTAHLLAISNSMTALAAVVFLVARLVHAFCYIAGITIIRSLAYNFGLLATLVIIVQIFWH